MNGNHLPPRTALYPPPMYFLPAPPLLPLPLPPLLPPDSIHEATLSSDSSIASSNLLWEQLRKHQPDARTALLSKIGGPGSTYPLSGVQIQGGVLRDFGELNMSAAVRGRVHRRITVTNRSIHRVRITDIVLRPQDVPFRTVNEPVGTVLEPGAIVDVVVTADLSRLPARDANLVRFWCLVGVESTSLFALWGGVQYVTMGCVVGAEFRANLAGWARASKMVMLDANAQPFFPTEFKKCFERAGAPSRPAIFDEQRADVLIPPGLRRVIGGIARVHIGCPTRAVRKAIACSNDLLRALSAENDIGLENVAETDTDSRDGGSGSDDGQYASFVGESLEMFQSRMSLGLNVEAEKMFPDIKRYDIIEAKLVPVSPMLPLHFKIHVPGLGESRPALVLFDPVRLRPTHEALYSSTELIARVIALDANNSKVTLKLPELCVHSETLAGILQASHKGGPMLRCHVRFCVGSHFVSNCQMLRVVHNLDRLLFRRITSNPPIIQTTMEPDVIERATSFLFSIPGADKVIQELNARQQQAVFMSVGSATEGVNTRWPVCIFGPPGTGKTRVLTAAVCVALLHHGRSTRILATAPSHQAADVLCERLSVAISELGKLDEFGPATMFRLNPYQVPVNAVRVGTLKHVCQDGKSGFFDLPPLNALSRYNIIVSTCASADLLSELPPHHFWTGVFCDESAQSLQPEALIPLNRFAISRRSRIVLAGDPHQLNADVRSEGAQRVGLNQSLMESVMRARARALVNGGAMAHNVHLCTNYRVKHSVLLELPSHMFYGGRLEADPRLAPGDVVRELPDLFPSGKPLLFVGSHSSEERVCERSPGLVNVGEAALIASMCARMARGHEGHEPIVGAGEITVICPHRAQVRAVRLLLRDDGLDGVKVGTVFDTQGQENRIVFVSLTVSTPESLAREERSRSGISSAKTFNVAVTRAVELLCVVGCPDVMRNNAYWGALLRFAVRAGCYSGVEFKGRKEMESEDEEAFAVPMVGDSDTFVRAVDEVGGVGYEAECEDFETLAEMFRCNDDVAWRVVI